VSVSPAAAVLVVDPDQECRDALARAMGRVGIHTLHAGTAIEGIELGVRDHVAMVVLETALPDLSGYQLCRELREARGAGLPIMFVSADRTEPSDRVAGLLMGADEYLCKPFDPEELSVRARKLMARVRAPSGRRRHGELTPRELQVLQLLAAGYDQRQIASELVISPRTVSTHVERVLTKAGVGSRAQAVSWAFRQGLVEY
jgi:DNA-binding NarL/FixJ family response regulator